jgi:hypothetical protein
MFMMLINTQMQKQIFFKLIFFKNYLVYLLIKSLYKMWKKNKIQRSTKVTFIQSPPVNNILAWIVWQMWSLIYLYLLIYSKSVSWNLDP